MTVAALRILIVDDEAPARRKVARFLRSYPTLRVCGEAESGEGAVALIRELAPDLVFLDVQMPGMSGFDVVEAIAQDTHVPHFIFATAHDDFAVRAFDVSALDYLLKPFDQDRFERAIAKAEVAHAERQPSLDPQLRTLLDRIGAAPAYLDRLLIANDRRSVFVPVERISRFDADRNHVAIHTPDGVHRLRTTLEALEAKLDPKSFVRIHRSHIVRIDAIAQIATWFHGDRKVHLRDGTELLWSRRYAERRPDLLRGT